MSPRAGGETAKFGERYEGRWTIHELLRVLEGHAVSIRVEEPGEAGAGIEFSLQRNDGIVEAHQVKRQSGSANSWTVRRLAEAGVLAAAADQIGRGREFHFVSMLPSQRISDMTDRARGSDDALTFVASLNGEQLKDLEQLEPLLGDTAECFAFLRSLFLRWPDERQIEETNAGRAGALIGGTSGPLAALALGDLVHGNLGVTLDAAAIREKLRKYELTLVEAAKASRAVEAVETVESLYESWENSLRGELLEPEIPREEAGWIADELEGGEGRNVLVAGPAGAGKSAVLRQVVRSLSEGWAVLPLRLDLIEPFSSTRELGVERLGLDASPAASLAALAGNRDCLLVVDQLDVVSRASGRMPATFAAVAGLLREASAYPNMRVLAACRQFDLDNDHRLRGLVTPHGEDAFRIPPLSDEEVEGAVVSLGIEPESLTPEQWELLRSPLHLVLLRAVPRTGERLSFATSKDLLDAFWNEKRRLCRARREVRFAETIGALADYMSANQVLSAPEAVLDDADLLDDADILASEHVLIRNGGKVAFFHEAFFDYAFARRWIVRDESLVEFLRSGRQELFQRAQVRQVLTHLRESDPERFLAEVEALLDSPDVRSHIKDVTFGILRALPDPSEGEWRLIERQLEREPSFEAQLWSVLGTEPWFDRLDAESVFEHLLASEDGELQDRALKVMGSVAQARARRVVELLATSGGSGRGELARRLFEVVGDWEVFGLLRTLEREREEEDEDEEGLDDEEAAGCEEVVAVLEQEHDRVLAEREDELAAWRSKARVEEIPSPVPAAEAAKMSDAEWRRAMAEHGEEHDGHSSVGGAEELARVLEELTESDPSRFAQLCLELDASIHPVYVNGILHGLGRTRSKVDPRLVFDAVRHAAALDREEHDYGISLAVRTQIPGDVPDDIVELVLDRALHSPDPPDSWSGGVPGDRHYKYDWNRVGHLRGAMPPDDASRTARGVACIALADFLFEDPDGHWTSIVAPAFPQLAADPVLGVRSCVARVLWAGLRHARDAALAALPGLIDCDDRVLAYHQVRFFLTDIGELEVVRPVIERMLSSENAKVREVGGELAAFAATGLGFEDLLAATSSADAAVRRGAAHGCAEQLPTAGYDGPAAAALRRFFEDEDEDVRAEAGSVVVSLREGRLRDHLELVEALIESPTFGSALPNLLNTLEETSGESDALVLLTARRFLDLFGDYLESPASLDELAAAEQLGELVTGAYSRASDAESRSQILDIIDELLDAEAYGFSDLVGGAER